jgi:hypothetical protein
MTARTTKKDSDLDVKKFIEILPKLIRENDTVKGAIISALSGVVATRDDIKDLIKRIEANQAEMDKRFDANQAEMDKRFEAMQERMDANHQEVMTTLESLKQAFGAPFEQFARNVVSRILEGEGLAGVELKRTRMKDPDGEVFAATKEVEIDGISDDPPVIAEITTVLRDMDKVEKFLKKKAFVEKVNGKTYRGFFVASGSALSPKERADVEQLLREHGCELLNL